MKLLGIAFFLQAVLCVCTVGEEDGILTSTINVTVSASTSKSVTEAVTTSTSQEATLKTSVLTTTAIRPTNESITSSSAPSSPSTTQQITQGTTTQPPIKTTTAAADNSGSTTNTTQASGTQLAQTESSDASSTKGWSSSTISLQNTASAPGNSGLHMSSPTGSTTFRSPESSPGNKKVPESAVHYSNIILPIVITLIVITLSAFSLVALYRMCQKKTPERQENGTEQAQSDKEGVKLLSVKTTSTETGSRWMPLGAREEAKSLVFGEARDIYEVGFSLPSANLYEPTTPPPSGEVSEGRTAGENSSQGKNKTRQLFTPQQ